MSGNTGGVNTDASVFMLSRLAAATIAVSARMMPTLNVEPCDAIVTNARLTRSPCVVR